MPYLRKYNTLLVAGTTAIRVPMIKRAAVDFAVGADWTPAAGDVKVTIDNGAAANVTNLPTAIAMGNTALWEFILTAAELSGKSIRVTIADSATKAVEDQAFDVETYGNASAMYPTDISAAVLPVNATQWNGLTTVALPLVPTTAGRTLDVSAGGEAGIDWANIGSPTTAVNLSATNFDVDQVIASVSGAVGSVTGAVGSVTGAVGSVTGAVGSVTGNVGGNVTGSVGSVVAAVAITSNIKKNQALSNFEFTLKDSTTHALKTGAASIVATRSIDGGAFGAGTLSAVTELSNGVYKINFGAGDLNGNVILLRVTATACDDALERIVTQP